MKIPQPITDITKYIIEAAKVSPNRTLTITLNAALTLSTSWHVAWFYSNFQAQSDMWLRGLFAVIFELASLAMVWHEGEHLRKTDGQGLWARYATVYTFGLFILIPASVLANFAYAVEFGWGFSTFDIIWLRDASIVFASCSFPLLNLVFAGILGNTKDDVAIVEDKQVKDGLLAINKELSQARAELKPLAKEVAENSAILAKEPWYYEICEHCKGIELRSQIRYHKGTCEKNPKVIKKAEAEAKAKLNGKPKTKV